MVCFLPLVMIRATRKRDPSSMMIANSYSSLVMGCVQCPPSALTLLNLGGSGSRDDAFLKFTRFPSSHMEQRNCFACSRICSLAPRRFRAWIKCLVLQWPVAACNKYSFLWISSTDFSLTNCCWTMACSDSCFSWLSTQHEPQLRWHSWCFNWSQTQKVP